ncbi:MAG: hydantoinase/oxoprolinase family protein [Pseudomonadota bacterium]
MAAHIDIDTGGTFTDVVVAMDGRLVYAKSPTTPHRLAEGCMNGLETAARDLGMSVEELLRNTEGFIFSTTFATNALIQRVGPRLGLITTEGFEDLVVIGKGSTWADKMTVKEMRNIARVEKPKQLIGRAMTVGVKERIDSRGEVVRPIDEHDVRKKVGILLDKGAEGFVVSLLYSYLNPEHEQRIKKLIQEEFQGYCLGSAFPIVLSSEVCPKRGEYTRTTTTVLNAYLQKPIQWGMMDLAGNVRRNGYKKSLLAIHCTGGMAPVYRSTPLQTYSAGPIAGLMAGSHLGKLLGFDHVVVGDMGGTSFDLSLVIQGNPRFYENKPVIEDWWVDMTMLWLRSIGAGGGSIAWINETLNNRLEVGPRSAGASPGPVAYDKGGVEPTVTDADIVLGYINPDYFFGGKMKLNKDLAWNALKTRIADPLGIDPVEAARRIKMVADANMGDTIVKETYLRGFDPREFVLFAAGAAGPTHCCGFGFYGKLDRIAIFPFSPVFCALGSGGMDIIHIYERSRSLTLLKPAAGGYFEDYDEYNSVVRDLRKKALTDVRLEGFDSDEVMFRLELEMKFGGQVHTLRIVSPRLQLSEEADVRAICDQFIRNFSEVYDKMALYPEGGIETQHFILHTILPRRKIDLPTYPFAGETVSKQAIKGKRDSYWEEYNGFRPTTVIDQTGLAHGNILEGPAIIESKNTTLVLPPGARMKIDKYLNTIIENMAAR